MREEMAAAAMRIGTSGWPHGAMKHAMGERSGEIFFREMRNRREQACLLGR
jgi:hypothetical protein